MASKYCPDCQRNVQEKKHFSIWWCIWTAVFPYLIYFYFFKHGKCRQCGCRDLEPAKSTVEISKIRNGQQ